MECGKQTRYLFAKEAMVSVYRAFKALNGNQRLPTSLTVPWQESKVPGVVYDDESFGSDQESGYGTAFSLGATGPDRR
eukprot:8827092-Lingulodinium_polyedra.AAC.1